MVFCALCAFMLVACGKMGTANTSTGNIPEAIDVNEETKQTTETQDENTSLIEDGLQTTLQDTMQGSQLTDIQDQNEVIGDAEGNVETVITQQETTPELVDTREPLPLSGHIICVDPGHCVTPLTGKGYTDPVSPLSNDRKPVYTTGTQGKTLTEEKLNLIVGLKLRDRLESLGATVIMTREVSEITISGVERCEIANNAGADVAVRIHADGNSDRSVHGVSVLVPHGELLGTPSIKDESVRLGKLMVDAVAEHTGAKNLGTINRTDLTGFNFSEVPAVLIEMGFMTNAEEDALLSTEEYQDKIVDGMVESLLQWYGVTT